MLIAITCLSLLAAAGIAGWALSVRGRLRSLSEQHADIEARHRELLEQTEHGSALRRKIEAQLLEKQDHLDKLAHHDQLTGLPNRLFLAAHLPIAMEEARKRKLPLAVLFLDLDRFKHVNDTFGHEVGDKLLRTVAQRVKDAVRAEDVVVRMGGDEFVVILTAVKSAQVNETAARITATLNAPIVIDGKPLVTTASVGVSLYPRDGEDVGSLLRHSDTAMYQAKERGRNNFQVFSPVMDSKLKERVAIEASLRDALEKSRIEVHYQPLIDIETRRVVTLEALVRWKDPEEGYISPTRFIPIAEETGLIVPLGDFVLQRVISDMASWRKQGSVLVPVAVNVSAAQLQRASLRARIEELTRASDLSPSMLQIELTESAMFEQQDSRQDDSGTDEVSELRTLGVRVAIDDFGTGYSSLSYLKRWRVDCLKIDRSFIRDLVTDTNDHAIVAAILAMAQHLRIKVIAEGVETWSQLEALRRLGCRYAQGYLFAEPGSAARARDFLNGHRIGLPDVETDLLKVAARA
ncbi:diguanylate cyclase (GGDEF)-like protein [Povalibacter uvarum]|uniref:Diguanylate cyclase (GGDEF)-like protein n=1 Tax=Povalibacter uvarum TaxID=732238 RepID=A0A841HGU4_9GAMM|nr:EAL domain-containing protein [Povalibacter uvarum]MBB6091996.1 diguanylate cyclase (GGDEF)-like protein [Povalibacter uvarum]